MHIMSTNTAKTLVLKHEYAVKLWRHKQRTLKTNDHLVPLNEPPPVWKFSAYATAWTHEDKWGRSLFTSDSENLVSCLLR